jgi:hypothetical protein
MANEQLRCRNAHCDCRNYDTEVGNPSKSSPPPVLTESGAMLHGS